MARKFYPPDQRPEIYFAVSGKICSAVLANFWENGLELVTSRSPDFNTGDCLTDIYICKYSRQIAAPDLQVDQINQRKSTWSIKTKICCSKNAERLGQALVEIENPYIASNLDDAAAADPSTIPRFTRKTHYSASAIRSRRQWAEQVSNTQLQHIAQNVLKPEALSGNIENFIGAVQIPVGVAGPILVHGLYTNGYVPLPVATTEGALISSICRGAQTCNQAGGIQTHVNRQIMLRAPVFFCRDMHGAVNLEQWIQTHWEPIREKAQSVSAVAKLERIASHVFDNTLHLQFYYRTGDAAGQNMTSACTWMACRWILRQVENEPHIGVQHYMIEGNLSGDKKAAFQNFTSGRGIAVNAVCRIPGHLLEQRLHITPSHFVRYWQAGETGGLQSGMLGSNINFANIVAGIFTATGQDIACVHESATGYLKARQQGDDLVLAVHLPSLVIGTVGGGTKLPTQQECLALMGCNGKGKVFRLAEIIAAACLALDLSTGAAVMSNEFVKAHEHFGRNRPYKGLSWSEITPVFFNRFLDQDQQTVVSADRLNLDTSGAIISGLVSENSSDVRGLFRYNLQVRMEAKVQHLNAVLKLKPEDQELLEIGAKVARLTGEDHLSGLFESQNQIFHLAQSNLREIEFYRFASAHLKPYLPHIFGTFYEERRRIYGILMEDLSVCSHMNAVNIPRQWQSLHIETVLAALAEIHAVYWQRPGDLTQSIPISLLDADTILGATDLLQALTEFNTFRFSELIPSSVQQILHQTLMRLPDFAHSLQQFPQTLTHNDFNPRNIGLRQINAEWRPVIYDWELALFQNPQHDVIEFLVFTLASDTPMAAFDQYVDFYRNKLEIKTGIVFNRSEFNRALALNALDLALVRFNLYLMGHNLLHFSFMDRVYRNLCRYLEHMQPAMDL